MSKIALVVDLKIAPGQVEAFLKRVGQHAKTCLAEEEGCLQFHILEPLEGSDRVFLYEVYRDQTAVDTHLGTERMALYLEDTGPMIAERTRNVCRVLEE